MIIEQLISKADDNLIASFCSTVADVNLNLVMGTPNKLRIYEDKLSRRPWVTKGDHLALADSGLVAVVKFMRKPY